MALSDHDDEVEEPPFRDPLPPDDRLWRHPSEIDEGAAPPPKRSLWSRLRRSR